MIHSIGKPPVLANGSSVPPSPAIRAGDFLFVSGQLGLDDNGKVIADDIASQTRPCFERLRAILALAGVGLDRIVKTNVWLSDKADFAAFNATYREQLPGLPPARSTVISELLIPGARVEIDAIVYLGNA
jgi:2-iminobutanoate/2-iminopropanoate deaminase